MNPIQLIMQMKSGNPQEVLMQAMQGNRNPILGNVLSLMQKGDAKGIEQIARNLGKEKGIDVDAMYAQLMNQLK